MFSSFFLAGFECSCGFTRSGHWFDQIEISEHDRRLSEDYVSLRALGIQAVREGIRWPLVDRGGRYDFSSVHPVVRVARAFDFTVIWDLFHFGYPQEADPFSPVFIERFAYYCHAVGRYLAREVPGPLYVTPVNEPSFLSFAGGEIAQIAPFERGRGGELKRVLAKAAIEGANAFRAAALDCTVVTVDPICRVVPPPDRPHLKARAGHFNRHAVFESLDMIGGKLCPELGGSREHLGIVGINYYPVNQWEIGQEGHGLDSSDPRRIPFSEIVQKVQTRYDSRVMITETGAVGDARAAWIREIAKTVLECREMSIDLEGVCLYPIMNLRLLGDEGLCGLWNLSDDGSRIEVAEAAAALRQAQRVLSRHFQRPTHLEEEAIVE